MAVFPFELLIERTYGLKQVESILCTKSLRRIPGRREVYDAVWKDEAVVVKIFSKGIGASRRLRKERNGLRRLRDSGVNAPELLFYGKTSDGRPAVVTEKIGNCPTALEAFENAGSYSERVELLVRVCRELAEQHVHGVLQKDLHLGNFLLGGERTFVLDPGQMRFFGHPLSRAKSISQLALLARHLATDDRDSILRLCREYFAARKWDLEAGDEKVFAELFKRHAKRITLRTLRKCLRTNKRQIRLRNVRYAGMFDRVFCGKTRPEDMVEQIDELMAGGEILKDGNTCYVSRFNWNEIDVVVKCYKHKSLIHSLRHTLKRSRARHGWLHAHRLGVLGISTPKPLAYVEELRGPVVWKSYLITEHVGGENLYYYLRDDNISAETKSEAIGRLTKILEDLAEYGVTHGDVKPSNILITPVGPCLTDLDSMQVHKLNFTCKIRLAKDIGQISALAEEFAVSARYTDEKS